MPALPKIRLLAAFLAGCQLCCLHLQPSAPARSRLCAECLSREAGGCMVQIAVTACIGMPLPDMSCASSPRVTASLLAPFNGCLHCSAQHGKLCLYAQRFGLHGAAISATAPSALGTALQVASSALTCTRHLKTSTQSCSSSRRAMSRSQVPTLYTKPICRRARLCLSCLPRLQRHHSSSGSCHL